MNMNVEGEVEEIYVRDDQQEAGMTRTFKKNTPTEINTGHVIKKPSKYHLTLSPSCKMEDEDITRDCTGEKTISSAMDGGLHSVDRPSNPSDSEQPRTVGDGAGIQGEENFFCLECGENFSSEISLTVHQKSHTGEKLHSCSDAGKVFHRNQTLLYTRDLTLVRSPFPALSAGNVFHISQILLNIREYTQERSRTPALSAGN
ncbi:hypothetical protein AB205_0163670, partial [Aquarana catesbeiana]